jgi:hypothetical protein
VGLSGHNSLIELTTEQAGSNCASGGVKLDVGVDTNDNGVLDTAEVSDSRYVCKGDTGPQGDSGSTGPAGPSGPTGPTGPAGPLLANTYILESNTTSSGCNPVDSTLTCHTGDVLLAGGCYLDRDQWYLRASVFTGPAGWYCRAISSQGCLSSVLTNRILCVESSIGSTSFGPINVPANAGWVDSGVAVVTGSTVTFTATGLVAVALGETPYIDPDGNPWVPSTAPGTLSPSVQRYALIGRVGANGTPFLVGSDRTTTMPASGTLYFALNDEATAFGDNSGRFSIRGTIE